MRTSASTPAVTHNDHVAAAAYLMKRAGATVLVVLDGQGAGQPVGIITKADVARAPRTWSQTNVPSEEKHCMWS
jgi:CBS domain-containing protein